MHHLFYPQVGNFTLALLGSFNLALTLTGYWSRRINDEHRIVYKVADDHLYIAQLRYHYE